MADSLTKSPNRRNPNARSSEINNPIRRSFGGNPFAKPSIVANQRGFYPITPFNSPSDFLRRNSINGESGGVVLHDYEDKENGKDQNLKPARVQSLVASKGTKNFMSQTISAASKFTASSLQKKILVEKNDSVGTSAVSLERKSSSSVSFSDVVQFIDSVPGTDLNENLIECSSYNSCGNSESIVDVISDSEMLSESVVKSECVLESLETKPGSSSLCPLAPLDADPSAPPYDPKTNYLSPRPQFLHYKPNPRIEVYLHRERKGMKLEDNFISECFSDTEVTDETLSEDSQKESASGSEVDMVQMEEEEDKLHVSVHAPISTSTYKENVEEKLVSKPHFFARWKILALIFSVLIACLLFSVAYSSVIDPFTPLYVPSELPEFAQANFIRLAEYFQVWTAKYVSYISKLISEFGVHRLEPLQYSNMTALHEDLLVGGYPIFSQKEWNLERENDAEPLEGRHEDLLVGGYPIFSQKEQNLERENDAEPLEGRICRKMEEDDMLIEEVSEGLDAEYEEQAPNETEDILEENSSQEVYLAASDVAHDDSGEVIEEHNNDGNAIAENGNQEHPHSDQTQENVDYELQMDTIPQRGLDFEEKSILSSEMSVVNSQASKPEELMGLDDMHYHLQSTELDDSVVMLDGSDTKILMHNVLGVCMLVLAICAATSFIYLKKAKTPNPNVKSIIQHSSPNWPTVVDMIGESIPPEMSCIHKSSSEAQSKENKTRKKYKRESSLATTSEYSKVTPSYGSFTTFERIPTKHHHGLEDDEVVTPVRRSSRIKNKAISP